MKFLETIKKRSGQDSSPKPKRTLDYIPSNHLTPWEIEQAQLQMLRVLDRDIAEAIVLQKTLTLDDAAKAYQVGLMLGILGEEWTFSATRKTLNMPRNYRYQETPEDMLDGLEAEIQHLLLDPNSGSPKAAFTGSEVDAIQSLAHLLGFNDYPTSPYLDGYLSTPTLPLPPEDYSI